MSVRVQQQRSTWAVIADASGVILARALVTGSIQGFVSYMQNRRMATRLFGFNSQEYMTDAALAAIGSIVADIGGYVALPFVVSKLAHSPTLARITAMAVPPLISGATVTGAKIYLMDEEPQWGKGLLEYGVVKLVADYASDTVFGNVLPY